MIFPCPIGVLAPECHHWGNTLQRMRAVAGHWRYLSLLGRTGGLALPATLTWDPGKYELGIFRFLSRQTLFEENWRTTRVLAEPY
jgi:hypothetical protein